MPPLKIVEAEMLALMLFMFFFFLGSIAMLAYLCRKLDGQAKSLSDDHAQLRVLLRAMESRLDKIIHLERINAMFQGQLGPDAALPGESDEAEAGRDPLLHLSFEKPQNEDSAVDPGLSLNMEPKTWDLGGPSEKG